MSLPAFAASMERTACQWSGVAIRTVSMSSRVRISRKSLYAEQFLLPYAESTVFFAPSRCFVSTSQTANILRSSNVRKFRKLYMPCPPRPIAPIVILSLGTTVPALPITDDGMTYGTVTAVVAATILFFRNNLREICLIGPIRE